MIRKYLFRFHLIRPAVWVGATVAVSLAYSPEAAAQGKKGGRVDIGDAAGGQPGAPGGQPGFPGGQPGFPGGGGEAAPVSQGPAKVPAYKSTPRKYKDAVIEPADDLVGALVDPVEAATGLVVQDVPELPTRLLPRHADLRPQVRLERGHPKPLRGQQGRFHASPPRDQNHDQLAQRQACQASRPHRQPRASGASSMRATPCRPGRQPAGGVPTGSATTS